MILITGGARSGKSAFAEKLASEFDRVVYVATAQALDDEMKRRIALHKKRRPSSWVTVEAPFDAHKIIDGLRADCLLFDCLTVYLSNFLCRSTDGIEEYFRLLVEAMKNFSGRSIVVTNEVGSGIVPMNELAREFRDRQGLINQQFAAASDEVYLCACGLPLKLK